MNENQVGVILEEVRDMFKTLAEGHGIIEKRLDRLEEGQQRLEQEVSSLKQDVARIDRKVDTIMEQTAVLTETVYQHEIRITRNEQRVG